MVAEGELPPGSVNADPTIDWGVERIPTFCVFELEVEDVPRRDRPTRSGSSARARFRSTRRSWRAASRSG